MEWAEAMVDEGGTTRRFLIYRNSAGAPNPYPDYSAGTIGGGAEVPPPIMSFPGRNGG